MAAFSQPDRRRFLGTGAALGLTWALGAGHGNATPSDGRVVQKPFRAEVGTLGVLAAAWGRADEAHIGLLRPALIPAASSPQHAPALEILWSHPVPTRAHGMTRLPDGALLFASRRPGDWLLRVDAPKLLATSPNFNENTNNIAQLHWTEPDRAFNGHAIAWGACVLTTETDLSTGEGLIGVREAASLEKIAEWPTQGLDPHQLLRDPADPTALLVANGGIPTQSDTGRRKLRLHTMDSSLVRLRLHDAGTALRAQIDGQWRLLDARLSLRHLAWGGSIAYQKNQPNQSSHPRRWLGSATQAEHDDEGARLAAPILALWDGQQLSAGPSAPAHAAWAGYGGDIAWDFSSTSLLRPTSSKAVLGRGQPPQPNQALETTGLFAVSAPRADTLTWWQPPRTAGEAAQLVAERPLLGAYALAEHPAQGVWVAGHDRIAHWQSPENAPLHNATDLLLDNHWQVFDI